MSPGCFDISATALATSSAAPPPMPTTLSAACARNACAPARTWLRTGLPQTPENTAAFTPGSSRTNRSNTGNAASPRSVTIKGRVYPASIRCGAISLRAPAPNTIDVGKAKRCSVTADAPSGLGRASARSAYERRQNRSRRSYDFEIALAFPVRHRVEPLPPFPLPRRREVVDEIVTEPVARALGLPEDARRLDQRARCARNVLGANVGPFDRRRAKLQFAFDAVEAGCEARGDGEIRIDVGAGTARFEPRRFRRPRKHAETRGSVVEAPCRLHGCPEAVDEALVTVDRRPEHRRELQQRFDLAGKIALEEPAHAVTALRVVKQIP